MAIHIKDKRDCSGCGACANICPIKCIELRPDNAGFLYPIVNREVCINCGLCEKVCPEKYSDENPPDDCTHRVYAAWTKDESSRYSSTSGGMFSELAKVVMIGGGKIVGASYDSNCMVNHIMIDDQEGLEKIRQSKYVQSFAGDIYIQVKKELDSGTQVLFCGAPCQVTALKKFLRKEYSNLYTVDFICRGMNSPKAYKYWLDELELKEGSKVHRVWFKYKVNGWNNSPRCTRIDFENGKELILDGDKNYYMRGYLDGNLYLRPSCSKCRFKGTKRKSDITLADFWCIPKEFDDDKGTSLVMINSERGQFLFEKTLPNINCNERKFEEISAGNVCFNGSVIINPKSEIFLSKLGEKPFSSLVKKYNKIPIIKRCKRLLKRRIRKISSYIRQN